MAAPSRALTPEEQARFDAGRTVYQNLCQACHQPDGRGMEKLAPSLIGSEFALARPPTIPIRIVLNGKEGTVALMPPLGGDPERRADRGRAHLHQARMGTHRVADRRRGRRAGAEGHRRPHPAVDER